MAEYIDREALLLRIDCYGTNKFGMLDEDIRAFIKAQPTADVAPVRHGRWIDAYPDIEPNPMFMYGICSECGFEQAISKYLKYCPDCGAQMDEKEDKHEDYT